MALAVDDWQIGAAAPQLSTDYLNRHGEALMLIEMAPMDIGVVEDLGNWRAVGYREHFAASRLRCTESALAAYEGLDPARRRAFEELCGAMNRLITTTTALLSDLGEGEDCTAVVDVASESLRNLIGRATRFINANGALDVGAVENTILQGEIDAMFAS